MIFLVILIGAAIIALAWWFAAEWRSYLRDLDRTVAEAEAAARDRARLAREARYDDPYWHEHAADQNKEWND